MTIMTPEARAAAETEENILRTIKQNGDPALHARIAELEAQVERLTSRTNCTVSGDGKLDEAGLRAALAAVVWDKPVRLFVTDYIEGDAVRVVTAALRAYLAATAPVEEAQAAVEAAMGELLKPPLLHWRVFSQEKPVAVSVLARFFDNELGEWVFTVFDPGPVPVTLAGPYTHWIPLGDLIASPPMPGRGEGFGPESEARIKRDGPFIEVDWWRYGLHLRARVYEPQMMPLSDSLADVLATSLEMRPELAEPTASRPKEDTHAE